MAVSCEFSPICGDQFQENHKCRLMESYISENMNEVLNAPAVLDSTQFKISDDAAWILYLEVVCLEYDGNAFDPALLACVAALQNTRLPDVLYNESLKQFEIPANASAGKAVKISTVPVPVSFAMIEDQFLVDPDLSDETAGSVVKRILLFLPFGKTNRENFDPAQ